MTSSTFANYIYLSHTTCEALPKSQLLELWVEQLWQYSKYKNSEEDFMK